MIKPPLNYPGNKARIAGEIIKYFPKEVRIMVEPFCGSATISVNTNYYEYYLNDIQKQTIELLKMFQNFNGAEIIDRIDKIIDDYDLTNTHKFGHIYKIEKNKGLSEHNKLNYLKLRESYNKTNDVFELFTLIIYGFNHYLRFNKKDEFNVPAGKNDFYSNLRKQTIDYSKSMAEKKISFSSLDFRKLEIYDRLNEKDLVYIDPPYFITSAPYNNFWEQNDDSDLFYLCDKLNHQGVKFVMSNVIESKGVINEKLLKWANSYKIIDIHRNYLNSSYQKKHKGKVREVLIKNF